MRRVVDEWLRRSPWLASLALAHFALFLLLAVLATGDSVQVLGIGRWIKPMKFCISIALYLGALAWFAPAVGTPNARRLPYAIIGGSMTLEMVVIAVQAARGTRSHFNNTTAFDAGIFSTMGLAIVLNTIALAWVGWLAFRSWRREPIGYRLGISLGILVALVSSAIGGAMIATQGHTVGSADGGPGLPFVNWSTVGGDLRVAHFIGLHALQALPRVGYRFGNRAVSIAAILWALITALTLAQAFAGRPLYVR